MICILLCLNPELNPQNLYSLSLLNRIIILAYVNNLPGVLRRKRGLGSTPLQPQTYLLEVLPQTSRGNHLQLSFLQSKNKSIQHRPENKSQLLFVTTEEMDQTDFETIMKGNPFRSFVPPF
jgi:hypothetical protein